MKELKFRAWHAKENKMYYRAYQKFLHVLLCEEEASHKNGSGKPVRRASYADCFLLESTGLEDKNHREIFESDIVRVRADRDVFIDVVGSVPDMFGSRRMHPLQSLLKRHGFTGNPDLLDIEVLGNEFENPELLNERHP